MLKSRALTGCLLIVILGTSVSVAVKANPTPTESEWVVVLKDPRPARLQGWQRPGYNGAAHYSQALELTRFANRVARKHGLNIQTEWYIESLKVYCLIVNFTRSELQTLDSLRQDDGVDWVQPSNQFRLLSATQHDTGSSLLSSPPELTLPESINGLGASVALIDSAVDTTHQDLGAQVVRSIDLVTQSSTAPAGEQHGTAMAGVIVADRHSNVGVTGIAPAAKLTAFRACWEEKSDGPNCNTLTLARALDAVVNTNTDVLNLSLSGPKDLLLDQIVERLVERGTMVVTAFDPNRSVENRFPSMSKGIIAVKAASNQRAPSGLLSAPGTKLVAAPGNRANIMSGHSVAAAYTTGVLALCIQLERQQARGICETERIHGLLHGKHNHLYSLIALLNQDRGLQ